MGNESDSHDVKIDQNQTWIKSMLKNRNPKTEADQQALLNTIKVIDTSSLSTDIQNARHDYAQRVGSRILTLSDSTKLQMTTLPNGIIDMQHIKKATKKSSPMRHMISFPIILSIRYPTKHLIFPSFGKI